MITLNVARISKLAQLRRRRTGSVHAAAVDINADFNGRRPSGDPRLDLAFFDRA